MQAQTGIRTDPLDAVMAGAFSAGSRRPLPLIDTKFEVRIDAGFAVVASKRVFRNDEAIDIEATLTFPLPVHATLFRLELRVGDTVLAARAQRRDRARATYEDAIERGKMAVLHEEVLRGVHMLSVSQIPPGAEIEVRTEWATTLTVAGDVGRLRIPLTVGDIYGRSGLADSDEPITGGPVQNAELSVACSDGTVQLAHGCLVDGRARVPLNAPIDIEVAGWTPRDLRGRAADGRDVVLRVEPRPQSAAAIDVAVVVDHSGSMAGLAGAASGASKHELLVRALRSIARRLRADDRVDLWEFNDALRHVGSTHDHLVRGKTAGRRLDRLLAGLSKPSGGTEIGRALAEVLTRSSGRDILLVTDGKSHALDVHALAQAGRRVSVILIGEDSLEANVGHLAALSGGEIFVAAGDDLESLLDTALNSLRLTGKAPEKLGAGILERVATARAGAEATAEWHVPVADQPAPATAAARAVAAFAASLALPALNEDAAARLAEDEGLVTHLTSLVLVNEAAAARQGVPATRKIALPAPSTDGRLDFGVMGSIDAVRGAPPLRSGYESRIGNPLTGALLGRAGMRPVGGPVALRRTGADGPVNLQRASLAIDWDANPDGLVAGDLSTLSPDLAAAIRRAALLPDTVALAARLKIAPIPLIIALIALGSGRDPSRSARRVANAVLGRAANDEDLRDLARKLGLSAWKPGLTARIKARFGHSK